MIQRTKMSGGATLLLLLVGACTTNNSPSRVIEREPDASSESASENEPVPTPPPLTVPSEETESSTAVSDVADAGESEVTDIGVVDAGPPDSGLTPAEEAQLEFERLYAARCPDQPADVMMTRGAGELIAAGPAVTSTSTRPQLSEAEADELYTIRSTLAAGGVFTVSYAFSGDAGAPLVAEPVDAGVALDGGADAGVDGGVFGLLDASAGVDPAVDPLGTRSLFFASPNPWYPVDEIEDVTKIVPGLTVDPNGGGTNTTIQSAIDDAVVVAGCPRVFIRITPGTYRQKIIVPAKTSSPPVTLYSVDSDASNTVIVYGDAAAGAEIDGTVLSIHTSATLTQSLPRGFQARNLTIANDYVEGTYPGEQAAVALMNQGDQAQYDNVRILGHRHSLYVKSTAVNEVSRTYFRNCYIAGDEDYILGRGAAVFDQCELHSRGDRVSTGAVASPSTRVDNPHGQLFINSEFTADENVSDVYLGRQWYEGDTQEAVGKVIIRNSVLGAHIRVAEPWAPVARVTPREPMAVEPLILFTSDDYYAPRTGLIPPEVYLAEFGNSGPGAAQ